MKELNYSEWRYPSHRRHTYTVAALRLRPWMGRHK
jgi:hypothetical protein